MKRTGAALLVEALHREGVQVVFGYPGQAIVPLCEELQRQERPRTILAVNEQGAAHAADGYARASGRVGVCFASSGPGATSLITALATAHMDSVPVVAITGQVASAELGKDAFQEADITGMTLSITKHSFILREARRIPQMVREAFRIAAAGRPGVVLIDVPQDVQGALVEESELLPCFETVRSLPRRDAGGVAKAVQLLAAARRPVLQVGGGVIGANASQAVRELARHLDLPVVSTLMGLGAVSGDDPRFLGLTGLHGHKAANLAVHHADLILAIGSRFSDRFFIAKEEFSRERAIVHLDIDPVEIGKNIAAHVGLVGDLTLLAGELQAAARVVPLEAWWRDIRSWQDRHSEAAPERLDGPWVMRFLAEQTRGEEALFVTDVGQNQMWAAQHLTLRKPRTWLTSGGFGTMGFGLPAAVGAQLACPQARVVHICGDGSFRMTGMELYTASCAQAPLLSIVLDNSALGMIRQLQELFFEEHYIASALERLDYVGVARSLGVEGGEARTVDQFKELFACAWAERRPFVLVARLSGEERVWPMLRPGGDLSDFLPMRSTLSS